MYTLYIEYLIFSFSSVKTKKQQNNSRPCVSMFWNKARLSYYSQHLYLILFFKDEKSTTFSIR